MRTRSDAGFGDARGRCGVCRARLAAALARRRWSRARPGRPGGQRRRRRQGTVAGAPLRQPQVRPGQPARGPVATTIRRLGSSGAPACRVEIIKEFETLAADPRCRRHEGWVLQSLLSGRRTALVAPWVKGEPAPACAALRTRRRARPTVVAKLEAGVIASVIPATGAGAASVTQSSAATRRLHRAGQAVGRLSEREGRSSSAAARRERSALLGRSRTIDVDVAISMPSGGSGSAVDRGSRSAGMSTSTLVASTKKWLWSVGVGVEIGLRAVDRELAQQAGLA